MKDRPRAKSPCRAMPLIVVLAVLIIVAFTSSCGEPAANNSFANKPANASNAANTANAATPTPAPTSAGDLRRDPDPNVGDGFLCNAGTEVMMAVTPSNANLKVNYSFDTGPAQTLTSSPLKFKCQKTTRLNVTYNFLSPDDTFQVVFSTTSGTYLPVPTVIPADSSGKRTVRYNFKV